MMQLICLLTIWSLMFFRGITQSEPLRPHGQGFDAAPAPLMTYPPFLVVTTPEACQVIRQLGLYAVSEKPSQAVHRIVRRFDATVIALIDTSDRVEASLRIYSIELVKIATKEGWTRRELIDAIQQHRKGHRTQLKRWERKPPPDKVIMPPAPTAATGFYAQAVYADHEQIGSVCDVATLTGRTPSAAYDEIQQHGAIDGMRFSLGRAMAGGKPRRPVIRLDLLEGGRRLFESVAAAGEATGIDPTTVLKHCQSKRRRISCGRYAFEFADQGNPKDSPLGPSSEFEAQKA